ncbi:MAG: hypothetical protein UY00_C0014G0013 [Candidatus Wolfebacteria bacterium GW2011_GWA1_47_6]|nr:MAG: hypothetical protein UY00_C0014G0013 [Candidatus Wolfebacteria bacterium GW2011_GWA1_47_6]
MRILVHDIRFIITNVDKYLEGDGVRGEGGESMRARLLHHMVDRCGEGNDACQCRSLEDVVQEERHR